MMRRIELTALFVVGGIVAAMAAPVWDAKDGVILPGMEAEKLLKQCSRSVPGPVTGYWMPEKNQIAELEVLAPAALEGALKGRVTQPLGQDFLRQYAGILLDGRKAIYVNAMPKAEHVEDWRAHARVICDGGPDFFGATYDPARKAFADFAFNGFP